MLGRLVAVALLAMAVVPAGAPAAARWFGFNDNATLTGDLTPRRDARLLARAGANSVRVTVDWALVGRGRRLDLSAYDRMYRAWTHRGIRPLLIVTGAPAWARLRWVMCPPRRACHVPPDRTHDRDWARFVAAVARRYPRAVAIEVWNEPNLAGFFAPAPDPARYAELLRIARDAVKAVRPATPVLGASLAPVLTQAREPANYGLAPFLEDLYAAGAVMDGLSIHPYPPRTQQAIDAALAVRDAHGDVAPLWLTELGLSTTGGVDAATQARVLADLVPRLTARPDVAGVYVHTLIDPVGRRARGPEAGYGVVGKPAFCALAATRGVPCRG
jgi:hypothetical protein